jgi:hypothetical protein
VCLRKKVESKRLFLLNCLRSGLKFSAGNFELIIFPVASAAFNFSLKRSNLIKNREEARSRKRNFFAPGFRKRREKIQIGQF